MIAVDRSSKGKKLRVEHSRKLMRIRMEIITRRVTFMHSVEISVQSSTEIFQALFRARVASQGVGRGDWRRSMTG